MYKNFEANILKNNLFDKSSKLLLAFSGGIDSVVLAHILLKCGYNFDIAHCNFKLRGDEANNDSDFCEKFANSIGVYFHTVEFDTKEYAMKRKLSTQMAARELRYNWFDELQKKHSYNCILTAHHANDNVETLFVNLIRGTGIKGLQGIPEKHNLIVRPLLFATKDEIKNYALKEKLEFREDSSNVEVKYKRNFIRHNIVPQLKQLNPTIEQTITTSIDFFKQSAQIVSAFASQKYKDICTVNNKQLLINISLLLQEPQKETLLFEWLYKMNFKTSQIKQLTTALLEEKKSGKLFSSSTHQLVIDRKFIIVQPIIEDIFEKRYTIQSFSDTKHLPIKLLFEDVKTTEFSNKPNEIVISFSEQMFPLTLRKWKTGDKFKPLGMNGFKKLSDFFKDQKLSIFDKEKVWILESKEQIIWIIGYRMDDRCKVTDMNARMIKLVVNEM